MTRRQFAAGAAAAASLAAAPSTRMGVATTCYMTAWRPRDTLEFIDHVKGLGAGGVQASLSSLDAAYVRRVRARIEEHGMFLEVMAPLPKADTGQFEAVLKAAKEAGATCVRSACLSGRRYETFGTLAAWKAFVDESHAAIKRAIPLAERTGINLALENHKDWTGVEFAAILRRYASPRLGVCLDTGNNISLLDDPMELIETLLPFAMTTHIKDMGVAPYADGFLLSEVPFGEGFLDIPKIVAMIREKKPDIRIVLEMITRDPLKVPCLTEKYWATFPERNGWPLARTLRMVAAHPPRKPLPTMGGKDAAAQRAYENDNVKSCLAYAKEKLAL